MHTVRRFSSKAYLMPVVYFAFGCGWIFTDFANAQNLPKFPGDSTFPADPNSGAAAQGLRDDKGALISSKTKKNFSEAQAEDITNENFPDLIESFDYPNAEIADIIKAISELTGKNFIVDPQVRGKITIIAPSRITVAEAYKAFLSALAINGMAVVPSGSFLKIKTARNAQRDSIETYAGDYFPTSDYMITRIIKLKYLTAEAVSKDLRGLPSTNGEMFPYPSTNSLIITDYGSNIERVMKIINYLDVPGFEEQLEVIRIRHAKSKDIADLVTQIITKGESGNRFQPGVPRFRRTAPGADGGSAGGTESYSLVVSDDRINAIVVVGNKAGIEKIRELIKKLDFRLNPEDSGGVFVYYVRFSEAEQIANTLNGIATESKKALEEQTKGLGGGPVPTNPKTGESQGSSSAIFGGDVKVIADKNTNSLVITASRQDFVIIKNLLSKIDIARDQVFVKVIIMEMNTQDKVTWGVDYYRFAKDTNGIGRMGFRSSDSLASIVDPSGDSGAILGFGSGDTFDITTPGGPTLKVSSLAGLIKFLKGNVITNILSTPQIMAIDNQESEIEVGEKVPVGRSTSTTGSTTTNSPQFTDATIKLVLTPYISPDTDTVQLKIDQSIAAISDRQIKASELASSSVATTTRKIKTQIVVNSGDTAVLGGLMSDEDSETVKKIPVLGDIPILGWLFKGKTSQKVKSNLTVFITPKIVRNQSDSAQVLSEKLAERLDFIQKNLRGRDSYGEVIDNLPRRTMNIPDTNDEFKEEPAIESF